jgi:hypothetical protein
MNSQISSEPTRLEPKAVVVDAQCEQHGPYKARQLAGLFGGKGITTRCPECSAVA